MWMHMIYPAAGALDRLASWWWALVSWMRRWQFRRDQTAENRQKEADLVRDRAAINQKAEALLETHGNSILRLAYSYLHSMEDAEEVLQDTLIQYLKTAPRLESRAHEKAWLLRVAGNISKNRISYNNVRSTDELKETLIAQEREDLSFVWDAVRELPVQDREVIHLFYYEGFSTREIAAILRQKETTVRSRLMRGREKLKLILKEGYDFEAGV